MIKTYDELLKAKNDARVKMAVAKKNILICGGTGCNSSGGDDVYDILEEKLKEYGLADIKLTKTGCFGFCAQGPIIKVEPDDVFYVQVKAEDVETIIKEHIIGGVMVERLLFVDPITKEAQHKYADMDFYKKQMRIVLRNAGEIDAENIFEYIAHDGYEALCKSLEMTPEEVIAIIKKSGLRGRGGAGFPTGLKWEFARKPKSEKKYIVCNADEGDPGAFMDRSILEGDPHSIIEAMAIGAYCIGADEGLVYIRAEYPLAIHRLELALEQARANGFLGKNIFGTDFSFDIKIKLGAGAFVCGEETALIHSMEGNRGEPTRKPPFPAEKGYKEHPTNVNNVETLANVPIIILKGAEWFSSIGTKTSKGTKVFALAGKINNIGLVEVPMGTTLREIVFDIGGGIPNNKKFKAVQTGGPSGGVITEHDLDTPIDYESLQSIGSMMGSGGMIVMDEDNDMVEIARFYLDFTKDESCGKCTPCRVGTTRILEMLDDLLNLRGNEETLDKLENLSYVIRDTALCGLGQTSVNPVLSTMHYFRDEYLKYAKREVKRYYIVDPALCIGCTRCAKVCPINCISGEPRKPFVIDETKCIECGACVGICPKKAIYHA